MKRFLLLPFCFIMFSLHAQKKFDVATGKNLLNLLPAKMNGKDYVKDRDKVRPAKGILGTVVQRKYGDAKQGMKVELINESPSLIIVNNLLAKSSTLDANKYLLTTIDGYPGIVQSIIREDGLLDYQLLIPLYATLLSVRSNGFTRDELIKFAQTIPVANIAKKISN